MESSPVNVYIAIMKAADHIDRHPQTFEFGEVEIPSECGTPGCALGWIGYFAKVSITGDEGIKLVARLDWACPSTPSLLNIAQQDFYHRMEALANPGKSATYWMHRAEECATRLRLYAEKYHGHEKPAERNFARELEQKLLTYQPEELAV